MNYSATFPESFYRNTDWTECTVVIEIAATEQSRARLVSTAKLN